MTRPRTRLSELEPGRRRGTLNWREIALGCLVVLVVVAFIQANLIALIVTTVGLLAVAAEYTRWRDHREASTKRTLPFEEPPRGQDPIRDRERQSAISDRR